MKLDIDKLAADRGAPARVTHLTFLGYVAVDTVVPHPGVGFEETRTFETPTTLYTLTVFGPESPPLGFDRFVASFQLATR